MSEAGVLSPDDRFELLAGEIYHLIPPGPLHAYLVDIIGGLLEQLAKAHGGHAREEKPIELGAGYNPQPDVALVRGPESTFRTRFPSAAEVLLIVEVSDSSLEHDQGIKLPIYAAAGVRELWLVNLVEQRVEIYLDPANGIYRECRIHRSGEAVAPAWAPTHPIQGSEMLGHEAADGRDETSLLG